MPTKRVAIYARVSTDKKGQDPENQLRQLRTWCERMGYDIAEEYVEAESGAKSADRRPTTPHDGNSTWCSSGRSTASAETA